MGLARMSLQADAECHCPYQGNQAEQGEDETTFGALSTMHRKPSLCKSIQLNTRLSPVQSKALSRPAPAETRGSKYRNYGRRVGSQRQGQEGSDRVKEGLRC